MSSDSLHSPTKFVRRRTRTAGTGRAIALSIHLGITLTAKLALAAGAFGTPQCVTVIDATIGMIGVMPPGSLDRNDTTLFPVGKIPPVKLGDLVEVEPARDGGAVTPTFRILESSAAQCTTIAKASQAETTHHAGHGHGTHGDAAPAPTAAPTAAP